MREQEIIIDKLVAAIMSALQLSRDGVSRTIWAVDLENALMAYADYVEKGGKR